MKRLFGLIDSFIAAMLGRLDNTGLAWARAGVIVLCVGAAMSADFGMQVSWKHALFLAGVTFVAAFGPEAAYKAFQMGKYGIASVAVVVSAMLLIIQFGVDQSYTAGIRGLNRDETRVANVIYDGAQDATKEDKANLEMWRKQLATLTEQNAWAPTVKAEALRAEAETLKGRIEEEKAGKRGRAAGCKSECERLQNELIAVQNKIGIVEQAADLTKRIEATQRILDSKRDVASKTEYKSSAVVHANTAIAKAVSFITFGKLKPSENIEEGTDIGINMAMALAATGVPAFCFLISVALYSRKETFAEANGFSAAGQNFFTKEVATYHDGKVVSAIAKTMESSPLLRRMQERRSNRMAA